MKITIRLFAILDIISIILISPQIIDLLKDLTWIHADRISLAKIITFFLLFISLFISAYGQLILKKWGLICYYIQFIPRIFIWVYSIGFLTYLNEFFPNNDLVFDWLFRIVVMFEFIRIYLSIRIQKNYLLK